MDENIKSTEMDQGIANTGTEGNSSASVAAEKGISDSSTEGNKTAGGIADSKQNEEGKGIADNSSRKDDVNTKDDGKSEVRAKVEEYTIEAQEGENLDGFNAMCKELKFTKAQAEGLVKWARESAKSENELAQKNAAENYANTIKSWHDTCVKDKEFGGKNWDTTLKNAGKVFDAFDETGELRKLLVETGYQHHPAVVRAFARAGKAMGEDTFINGKGGKEDELTLAEKLYPGFKY